jgi:hypothetical protein
VAGSLTSMAENVWTAPCPIKISPATSLGGDLVAAHSWLRLSKLHQKVQFRTTEISREYTISRLQDAQPTDDLLLLGWALEGQSIAGKVVHGQLCYM